MNATTITEALLANDLIQDAGPTLPRHPTKHWRQRDPAAIKGVVIHQSLGAPTAHPIARYHVGPNHLSATGLPSIAYTLFVERSGRILLCSDVAAKPWSQGTRAIPGDENADYLAVCVGGNFSADSHEGTEEPSLAQLRATLALWQRLRDVWGFSNTDLHGHCHFGKPACPGRTLRTVIEAVRKDGEANSAQSHNA